MGSRNVGRGAPATSPHPVARPGSPTVSAEGCAVLRQGDVPLGRRDALVEGSASVSADGIPLSRDGHVLTDGTPLTECASSVDVAAGHVGEGEGDGYVRFHIHVDADRDGVVDDDWEHNGTWSPGRGAYGAIALVNCDDETHASRSPGSALTAERMHAIALDHGEHASGTPQRRPLAAEDLDDIAPLVIRRDPRTAGESHAGWKMRLKVSRRFKFRVFDSHAPGAVEIIGPLTGEHHEWTDLSQDEIVLCMEGVQYPGPWPWQRPDPDPDASHFDGRIVLTLEIYAPDGSLDHSEEAVIRVTPWIAFTHFDPTVEVLVASMDSAEIVPGLRAALDVPLTEVSNAEAVWAQDGMEPGFSTLPKAGPAEQWHIESHMAGVIHEGIQGIYHLARMLHGPRVGYVQPHPENDGRINTFWTFGNLECTPPFRHRQRGTVYPFGRLVYGVAGANNRGFDLNPDRIAFYEAQVVQAPIAIETGWLGVGHVDEIICFLPMQDAALGFRVLWASPQLALDLVDQEVAAGRGGLKLLGNSGIETPTLQRLAGDDSLRAHADFVETKMAITRQQLKDAIGLADDDFIALPVLFRHHGEGMQALTPDVVNGLVVTHGGTTWEGSRRVTFVPPDTVLAGNPLFSPVFNAYVESALSGGGVTVRFVNAWTSYHLFDGEVHCGTNSIRRAPTDRFWWEHMAV